MLLSRSVGNLLLKYNTGIIVIFCNDLQKVFFFSTSRLFFDETCRMNQCGKVGHYDTEISCIREEL